MLNTVRLYVPKDAAFWAERGYISGRACFAGVLCLPAMAATASACPVCPPEASTSVPPEAKRERELAGEVCAFCHEGEDSDDPDEDPLIPINTGKARQQYAHENCIYWCPDVFQSEDMEWQNLGKALSRCHRLKCAVCGEARSSCPGRPKLDPPHAGTSPTIAHVAAGRRASRLQACGLPQELALPLRHGADDRSRHSRG